MYNFVPDLFGPDILMFLIGIFMGWILSLLFYDGGFEDGWHHGVEDVIAIMKGEEIDES